MQMQNLNKAKPYVTKDFELKILRALENYEILKENFDLITKSDNTSRKEYGLLLSQYSKFANFVENDKKILFSDELSAQKCHIQITNYFSSSILLCWIDRCGNLHHFYPLNDDSIKDKSVSNKHLEYSFTGHAFIIIKSSDVLPKCIEEIRKNQFIVFFKPKNENYLHEIILSKKKLLRSKNSSLCLKVNLTPISGSHEVVNSSDKVYLQEEIHGFAVLYESEAFDKTPNLRSILSDDLAMVKHLLPDWSYCKLKETVKIWLNISITFGPKNNPIEGTNCTYHSIGGSEWLVSNGLSDKKAGCIEIYSAREYLESRHLWGTGGVLLHEFSHAFHDQFCDNGYQNEDIRDAYHEAMKEEKYHKVSVHGPQGENGKVKAYACTNCMEFFAELSVAFLYNKDTAEYNKWFPHNRSQLFFYDPKSCKIIAKMWNHFF